MLVRVLPDEKASHSVNPPRTRIHQSSPLSFNYFQCIHIPKKGKTCRKEKSWHVVLELVEPSLHTTSHLFKSQGSIVQIRLSCDSNKEGSSIGKMSFVKIFRARDLFIYPFTFYRSIVCWTKDTLFSHFNLAYRVIVMKKRHNSKEMVETRFVTTKETHLHAFSIKK